MPSGSRRGDYGFDAPYVPLGFSAGALLSCVLAIFRIKAGDLAGVITFVVLAVWFAALAVSYVYTTRRGKFRVWAELLDALRLLGTEHLLDVGCGRGAVLLMATERLPRGRATGIDLWSTTDQSGNAEGTTRKNAALEGVSDRIELITGNMCALPFPDASFDVVTSSLAIHNVPAEIDRLKAIDEIHRVLKPGGRAILADFKHTDAYARRLSEQGALDVKTRSLGWRFWYGGPFGQTRLVEARKAA